MLIPFGPDIWLVDGQPLTAAAGFHYPTRMAVIRLDNSDLVVWSPTAISDDLSTEISTLGPVRFLIPPNALHHTYLLDWQRAYPEALVFAPPGLRDKRSDIRFDGDFTDGAIAAWHGQLDVAVISGNRIVEEVVFFHRRSATTIFTDLIQHFPAGWFTGWRALVARLDLMVATEPSVPRKFRVAFSNRAATREALRPVLDWPSQRVVFAHGAPVTRDGQAFLRRAFAWLG